MGGDFSRLIHSESISARLEFHGSYLGDGIQFLKVSKESGSNGLSLQGMQHTGPEELKESQKHRQALKRGASQDRKAIKFGIHSEFLVALVVIDIMGGLRCEVATFLRGVVVGRAGVRFATSCGGWRASLLGSLLLGVRIA